MRSCAAHGPVTAGFPLGEDRLRTIPTDLLRTLVTVADLASWTRAGDRLGRSQPAISLQIKRLQELLGVPLFDRARGGAVLSEAGMLVASYARRILALEDALLAELATTLPQGRLTLGVPDDFARILMPGLLEQLQHAAEPIRFEMAGDLSARLLERLDQGELDLAVAMTLAAPKEEPFRHWREGLAWVGRADAFERPGPLRLLAQPEGCVYRQVMLDALQRAGRDGTIVYTSPSLTGLEAALTSGFGITVLARRIAAPELVPASTGLPALPDASVGIYLADGPGREQAARLAALLARSFG